MAIGAGLSHLMQSPDLEGGLKSAVEQFSEWLRQRGTGASMGQQGVQQPVGVSPYERAGQMREAGMQGIDTMMGQAGEAASESFQPKTADYMMGAAAVALPIVAALLPEGRGRRGRRKSERMSKMLSTLGGLAGQGLQARMGSFEAGKEATFGAAESRAELAGEEVEARYKHTLGGIDLERDIEQQQFGRDIATGRLGLAQRKQDWVEEKPEKPPFTPYQQYQIGRGEAVDVRRDQVQTQKDVLVQANKITRQFYGTEFVINSVQDLDEAIYSLENYSSSIPSPIAMKQGSQNVLQQLRNLRDQYYGGETPMLPMGGGQTGKPADMTDAEWQEYQQMKGQ